MVYMICIRAHKKLNFFTLLDICVSSSAVIKISLIQKVSCVCLHQQLTFVVQKKSFFLLARTGYKLKSYFFKSEMFVCALVKILASVPAEPLWHTSIANTQIVLTAVVF